MICKGLNLNSILEIMWNDEVFNSNVQDITHDSIEVSIPVKDGEYLPLTSGMEFEAIYYDDAAVYKFKTKVKGRKIEKIPILIIEIPDDIVRIQRRKFVRIETIEDIKYTLIKTNFKYKDISDLQKFNVFLKKSVLTDISGGGMKIITKEQMKNGDRLIAKLPLKNEYKDEMVVMGKVVRIQKNQDGRWSCGINFLGLNDKYREKIILYVFELMRKQRRKS